MQLNLVIDIYNFSIDKKSLGSLFLSSKQNPPHGFGIP